MCVCACMCVCAINMSWHCTYDVNPLSLHHVPLFYVHILYSMLASLKEAYEAQSAALKELQAQVTMIAERHNASMKWHQAQMEESDKFENTISMADSGRDDYLQQQGLEKPVQLEVHPSSSGDI